MTASWTEGVGCIYDTISCVGCGACVPSPLDTHLQLQDADEADDNN